MNEVCRKCGAENQSDTSKLGQSEGEKDAGKKPAPRAPMFYSLAFGVAAVPQIDQTVKLIMLVIISIAVLTSSLYILLCKKYTGARLRWAISGITAVTSFWLGRIS